MTQKIKEFLIFTLFVSIVIIVIYRRLVLIIKESVEIPLKIILFIIILI